MKIVKNKKTTGVKKAAEKGKKSLVVEQSGGGIKSTGKNGAGKKGVGKVQGSKNKNFCGSKNNKKSNDSKDSKDKKDKEKQPFGLQYLTSDAEKKKVDLSRKSNPLCDGSMKVDDSN